MCTVQYHLSFEIERQHNPEIQISEQSAKMDLTQQACNSNSGFSTVASSDLIELSSWDNTASPSLTTSNTGTNPSPHTSTASDLVGPADLSTACPSKSLLFTPTVHLQIETPGHRLFGLPVPPKPSPIPILAVDPKTGAIGQTLYFSLRHTRHSGSAALVRAPSATTTTTSADARTSLSTTTYRAGPFRPPHVRLFVASNTAAGTEEEKTDDNDNDNHDNHDDYEQEQEQEKGGFSFKVTPRSPLCLTRTQVFHTPLGTFEWRYASRSERRCVEGSVGGRVNSLLVMDHVLRIFPVAGVAWNSRGEAKGKGKWKKASEQVRTPVARFLRGDGLRTPGTGPDTAGNGGRLMIDFGVLKSAGEEEKEELTVLVVTTCLVMLKKEIDRRRALQVSAMASGGGGP